MVFEQAIASHLHEIHIHLELGQTEAIKTAVIHGLRVSCLPLVAVQPQLDQGQLVEIRTPFLDLRRQFHLLVHRDKYRSRLIGSLIEHLARHHPADA